MMESSSMKPVKGGHQNDVITTATKQRQHETEKRRSDPPSLYNNNNNNQQEEEPTATITITQYQERARFKQRKSLLGTRKIFITTSTVRRFYIILVATSALPFLVLFWNVDYFVGISISERHPRYDRIDSSTEKKDSLIEVSLFDNDHFEDDIDDRDAVVVQADGDNVSTVTLKRKQQCWISISDDDDDNNDNEKSLFWKLLGCGTDGHVFQTTMICHRHQNPPRFEDLKENKKKSQQQTYDVVVKVMTNDDLDEYQSISKSTIDQMNRMYNMLVSPSRISKQKDGADSASPKPKRSILRKHFIVPFATARIPIEVLYRRLRNNIRNKEGQKCGSRVLPEEMNKAKKKNGSKKYMTRITAFVMEEAVGQPLHPTTFSNELGVKSSSSSTTTTTAAKTEIIKQALICLYQHMYESKVIHQDIWLKHFVFDDISKRTSLIDYTRYDLLSDGNNSRKANLKLQKLQLYQLLTLLSNICVWSNPDIQDSRHDRRHEDTKKHRRPKAGGAKNKLATIKQKITTKEYRRIMEEEYPIMIEELERSCFGGASFTTNIDNTSSLLIKAIHGYFKMDHEHKQGVIINASRMYEMLLQWMPSNYFGGGTITNSCFS